MNEAPFIAAGRRVDALESIDRANSMAGALSLNATLEMMEVLHGRRRFLPGDFRTAHGIMKALVNLPAAQVGDDAANPAPRASSVPSDILDKMEEALKGAPDQIQGERAA